MIHDSVGAYVMCRPEVMMSLPGAIVSEGASEAAGRAPVFFGWRGV